MPHKLWSAAVAVAGLLLVVLVGGSTCSGKQAPSGAAPGNPSLGLNSVPRVTVVAVTDWQATLKPCGCTVDLQKGGVERIGHWLAALRQHDDSVLVVHAGSLVHDAEGLDLPGKQAQLALRQATFVQALDQLGVAAVALSQWDIDHGGAAAARAYQTAKCAVLAAVTPANLPAVRPFLITRTASGVTVGVVALSDDAATQTAALPATIAELRRQGAQVVVALANTGLRGARKLARAVPGLDLIVVGQLDDKVEPLSEIEREGTTLLVHAARHGAWVTATTLVPGGGATGAWQDAEAYLPNAVSELTDRRAALDTQLTAALAKADLDKRGAAATQLAVPFYKAQLAEFDKRIAAAQAAAGHPLPSGRLVAFRAVGLVWSAPTERRLAELVARYDQEVTVAAGKAAGVVAALSPGQPGYVGQATCLACHAKASAFARQDQHHHAWTTLQEANKTADLDCVPCHVTGFGKPGGSAFRHLDTLSAVQCEACHGPGSQHVAAPAKGVAGHLLPVSGATCAQCHTAQHSPQFAFDHFRKRLLVPGHGLPAAPP